MHLKGQTPRRGVKRLVFCRPAWAVWLSGGRGRGPRVGDGHFRPSTRSPPRPPWCPSPRPSRPSRPPPAGAVRTASTAASRLSVRNGCRRDIARSQLTCRPARDVCWSTGAAGEGELVLVRHGSESPVAIALHVALWVPIAFRRLAGFPSANADECPGTLVGAPGRAGPPGGMPPQLPPRPHQKTMQVAVDAPRTRPAGQSQGQARRTSPFRGRIRRF